MTPHEDQLPNGKTSNQISAMKSEAEEIKEFYVRLLLNISFRHNVLSISDATVTLFVHDIS